MKWGKQRSLMANKHANNNVFFYSSIESPKKGAAAKCRRKRKGGGRGERSLQEQVTPDQRPLAWQQLMNGPKRASDYKN